MEHIGTGESTLLPELVDQQLQLWNARREAAREVFKLGSGFRYLTIARDEGSLENEIAQELGRHLEWHVFNKEIVTYIARNSHVRESLVRQLDQKSHNLFQDTITRLLSMPVYSSFGAEEYREALLRTLICLAQHGSAIIVGRGANFLLKDTAGGLNVRITASPESRLQRLSQSLGVTLGEARCRMEADDDERRRFIRQSFGKDFDDMRFYDFVLNTDRLSIEQSVISILSVIKGEHTRTTQGLFSA